MLVNYIVNMKDNKIISLTTNENKADLEKYLRPQWSWKTFIFIISTILLMAKYDLSILMEI